MTKKGLSVWLFSSLTFIALAHLIDATFAFVLGNPIRLIQLYPFLGEKLQTVSPQAYFWVSVTAFLVLWGITCAVVFENPVESFLNKVLSDAKSQNMVENQALESKSEILDMMYETIVSSSDTLSQVKDIVFNVRTEAKEIQPLKDNVERLEIEFADLKKEIKRIEKNSGFPILCTSCGKPLMPQFKICPYCGENRDDPRIVSTANY